MTRYHLNSCLNIREQAADKHVGPGFSVPALSLIYLMKLAGHFEIFKEKFFKCEISM